MKKTIISSVLATFVGVSFVAGMAMADPVNPNRPYDSGNLGTGQNSYGEDRLQEIFNNTIDDGLGGGNPLDSVNGQSPHAIWTPAEAVVDQYLITMLTGDPGDLGIYSFATGAEYNLMSGGATQSSFTINNAHELWIGGALVDNSFGESFGFYFDNYNQKSYTEDSKNGNSIRSLSYLVEDGWKVDTQLAGGTTVNALGNNDWIVAFEDGNDEDFQDGVFYMEDMNPVPEPATMLLFGTGLAGLAGVARRKRK